MSVLDRVSQLPPETSAMVLVCCVICMGLLPTRARSLETLRGTLPCSLAAKGGCDAFASGDVWELGGAQGKRTTTQVLSNMRRLGKSWACWLVAAGIVQVRCMALHRLQAKLGR